MNVTSDSTIQQLREARLRLGLSQAEAAERIGTTQSAIARLESGQSDPRLSTLQRYAKIVSIQMRLTSANTEPSLVQVAAEVHGSVERGDANDALRLVVQLLDDLEGADDATRRNAIRDEPGSTGDPHWDALLAGVAEYVSRRGGFVAPGWTAAPSRFLHQFWFVIEDIVGRPAPGLATLSFTASPPELANRGVFLDRASLVSV